MKLKIRPDRIDPDWLRTPETRRLAAADRIRKHAAPIHPGTGTDQSVHGGGGGGTTTMERPTESFPWRFTETYDDSDPAFREFEEAMERQNADLLMWEFDLNGDSRTVAEWRDYFNFSSDTPPRKVIQHMKRRGDIGDVILPEVLHAPAGYGMRGQFYGPALDPVDVTPQEAFAEVESISSHVDDLWVYAEQETGKVYDELVEEYLADDYDRFDRETGLKLMGKRGLLDRYRKSSMSKWRQTEDGKRWDMEVVIAQKRAKEYASAALPELLERGQTLHDEVLADMSLQDIGNEYEGGAYYGGYTVEVKKQIAADHPEFQKRLDKIHDLHAKGSEIENIVHEIEIPHHTNSRPREEQPPSWDGGKPWYKAKGEAFFALRNDDVKRLKDGTVVFKDWKQAAKTQGLHYEMRTVTWADESNTIYADGSSGPSYGERFKIEDEFQKQFEADMGPDYTILDAASYDHMWEQAHQSGRRSYKRNSNAISRAVEEFDEAAEAKFKTTRRDLIADGLRSRGIEIGGEVLTTHGRRTKGTETMETGAKYLPSTWIDRSNTKGPVTLEFLKHSRAHYDPRPAKLRVDGSLPTTLHEFGHRIQHIDPTLRAYEDAFYDYRTKGESSVPLKSIKGHEHYPANEMTKADDWLSPYTGKKYAYSYTLMSVDGHVSSNNMSELVSTGYPTWVMTNRDTYSVADNAKKKEELYFMWGLVDATGR